VQLVVKPTSGNNTITISAANMPVDVDQETTVYAIGALGNGSETSYALSSSRSTSRRTRSS